MRTKTYPLRDRVDLVFTTPLDGCFTKPVAAATLRHLLDEKASKSIRCSTRRRSTATPTCCAPGTAASSDLLVTVPTHRGAAFLGASGLGNELDFVPTHRHTLLAKGHDDIFALGDTTDLPSSKAGSVAHFQSEVLAENVLRTIAGRSLDEGFDGHANCFIESGFGKALEGSSRALAGGAEQEQAKLLAIRGVFRLSPSAAKKLAKELNDFLARLRLDQGRQQNPRTKLRRYSLTIAFLPAEGEGD